MDKVWIVEQGEYSDYSVLGIFSTKENAELVAEDINKDTDRYYDIASVRECTLDPGIEN